MQEGLLGKKHLPDTLGAALDFVGTAVLQAAFQQMIVEAFHGIHPGNRNKEILPAVAHQILHQALFVAAGNVAEVGGKDRVGRKHPVIVLGNGMQTESLLDADFTVVKDEPPGYPSEVVKHSLLGLQKAFRILVQTGHDKNVAAVAESAAEDLNYLTLSTQVDGSFAPVDLNSVAGIVFQGHIRLCGNILGFHFVDHTAHDGVGAGESLLGHQTVIDPFGRIILSCG